MFCKSDMVASLKKRHENISKEDVVNCLDLILNAVTESIDNGDRVEVRRFGVWRPRSYKSRFSINPFTGKKSFFPARKAVLFSPSDHLVAILNNKPDDN